MSATPPDPESIITDAAIRARVAEVLEAPAHKTVFDQVLSHPLTSLILGFVLTGIVGGILTESYQNHAEEAKRSSELREVRRSQRLAALDSIGLLLNEGYYVYGRFSDLAGRSNAADRPGIRKAFDLFNERLEKREIVDAARVCATFGTAANHRYVASVRAFHTANFVLRSHAEDSTKEGTAKDKNHVAKLVYGLRDSLFSLLRDLARLATDSTQPTSLNCTVPDSSKASPKRMTPSRPTPR